MSKYVLYIAVLIFPFFANAGPTPTELFPGPWSSSPGGVVTKIWESHDPSRGYYYEIKLKDDSRIYRLGLPGSTNPGATGELRFRNMLSMLLTAYSTGKPVTFYGGPYTAVPPEAIYIHRVSLMDK